MLRYAVLFLIRNTQAPLPVIPFVDRQGRRFLVAKRRSAGDAEMDESGRSGGGFWIGLIFVLLLLASPLLGLGGWASYVDSYSHDADRFWGLVTTPIAGASFLCSAAALGWLALRKPLLASVAIWLGGLAIAGLGLSIYAGCGMVAEAHRRGGDYGGLAVIAGLFFGILCPAGLAALNSLGVLLLLRQSRRSRTAANGPAETVS